MHPMRGATGSVREEIQCLGAQLESARSSRQELSGEHLVFPGQVPGMQGCSLV